MATNQAQGAAAQGTGAADSKEQPVKREDLPVAIQKAADREAMFAKIAGYGVETVQGQRLYKVHMTLKRSKEELTKVATLDGQGNVLELVEQVDLSALPFALRDGLKAQAGKGTIVRVESITKKDLLVGFRAQVREGNKEREIESDPAGKPLNLKK